MTNRKKPVFEATWLARIDDLRNENEAYTRRLMQAGANVARIHQEDPERYLEISSDPLFALSF